MSEGVLHKNTPCWFTIPSNANVAIFKSICLATPRVYHYYRGYTTSDGQNTVTSPAIPLINQSITGAQAS